MSETHYIYELVDPRTNKVRYIGQTLNIKARYHQHVCPTASSNRHKNNWIRSLTRDGLEPIINVIEECSTDNVNKREVYWIAKYKEDGFKLCNLTSGGEGVFGFKFSKESLAKRTKSREGFKHTQESIQRMSEVKKGKTQSKETRIKISQAHMGKIGHGRIKVLQLHPDTNEIIREFPAINEAAKAVGVKPQSMSKAIKKNHKCRGHLWKKQMNNVRI